MSAADPATSHKNASSPNGFFNGAVPVWSVYVGAAVVAMTVLFWDAIGNLWVRWGQSQELSHSYFIPLISAWLVWTNRDAVKKSVGAPSLYGALGVVASCLLLLLGEVTHIYVLQHIGLVVCIAGLTAAFGGLSLLKATAAPIGFLFFAVPPPYWAITVLSWKFRFMSSVLGVSMLQMMDIPVYLSGNIIDLGDYKLQVAEACSGLRYLFPFISLGVMTAYLYRGPLWQRLVIVLSTIPITIFMNSFRIAMTGYLVQTTGIEHAEGALHMFEGWVVFLLCMLVLFGVMFVLNLFARPRMSTLNRLGAPDLSPVPPSRGALSLPKISIGVIVLAVAVFSLSHSFSAGNLIEPDRKPFASVPDEFPGWRHAVKPLDPEVAETLGADDSIVVDLGAPDGQAYNLYFAYLAAQRDGRSWHSPRQCIPGGGWQITSQTYEKATTADGVPFSYNRLIIENHGARQLVYYWYDQRGRKIANEFVMKFWLIVDAAFKKRTDGAMVRIITPVGNEETVEDADARLHKMMARVETFLPEYVPN